MRFSDSELGLFKGLFSDNEEMLFLVRKLMLQFELNQVERQILGKAMTKECYALMRKLFLPQLEADAPMFQLTDMHLGLNTDWKDLTPQSAAPMLLAKELEIDYIAQQLAVLKDLDFRLEKIKLAELVKRRQKTEEEEDVFARITARNYLLSYIDSNMQQARFLAGLKQETVEQTKQRLAKDSNK